MEFPPAMRAFCDPSLPEQCLHRRGDKDIPSWLFSLVTAITLSIVSISAALTEASGVRMRYKWAEGIHLRTKRSGK